MRDTKGLEALRRNDADIERKLTRMFLRSDIRRHALRYYEHITRLTHSTDKAQTRVHLALAQDEHDQIVELAGTL